MVSNGGHAQSLRRASPVRAMHARCMSQLPVSLHARRFGVELDIDGVENHRRKVSKDPPARRSHTEVEATMQAFGVGLGIDAEEHNRRKVSKDPPARRSHTEVEATMQAFGIGLDIDAVEHHRRKLVGFDPPARRSHTEIEATMQAFGVSLDIDAAEHHRRKTVGQDRQYSRDSFQVLPDVDVSHSWDLPLGGMVKGPKAERRPFWEQTHWAEQWARLLGRPRRGNRNSVWQAEVSQRLDTWDDLPGDVQAHLRAIKCDLECAVVQKRGRAKVSGSPAQPLAKPAEGSPVLQSLDELYEQPVAKTAKESPVLKSSDAEYDTERNESKRTSDDGHDTPSISTDSGDECSLHRQWSSRSDTDSAGSMLPIVKDPKGKHVRFRQAKDAWVAPSCQQLHLPLGLRRVMCALNPADAESPLQLSGDQIRKLTGLRCALQTQKQTSGPRKRRPFS